jgi:transposase InsO family protein
LPDLLGLKIIEIFEKAHKTYGVRRIKAALKSIGLQVGRSKIKTKMNEYGLTCKATKKYKATTNSKHNLPVSPNLLKQNFVVTTPNRVWVSDFTYIWTLEGWMYLAVVIDLYSRRVVGWALSNRMKKELVIDALQMAIKQRKPPEGLIVHSDRGSMSKKGDCYDNACAERFFHSFKVEWVYGNTYPNREICKQSAIEYIEVFYNRQRFHSYLGYLAPCQFERVA